MNGHPKNARLSRIARAALASTAVAGAVVAASPAAAQATDFGTATVHANGGLVSHIAPTRHAPATSTFANGSTWRIDCTTTGTSVNQNAHWYLVVAEGEANWVSGAYLTVHHQPATCGADTLIKAKTTKATQSYAGPSTKDSQRSKFAAGTKTTVRCYVHTASVADKKPKWLLTSGNRWVRATAVKASRDVPYCSQIVS